MDTRLFAIWPQLEPLAKALDSLPDVETTVGYPGDDHTYAKIYLKVTGLKGLHILGRVVDRELFQNGFKLTLCCAVAKEDAVIFALQGPCRKIDELILDLKDADNMTKVLGKSNPYKESATDEDPDINMF